MNTQKCALPTPYWIHGVSLFLVELSEGRCVHRARPRGWESGLSHFHVSEHSSPFVLNTGILHRIHLKKRFQLLKKTVCLQTAILDLPLCQLPVLPPIFSSLLPFSQKLPQNQCLARFKHRSPSPPLSPSISFPSHSPVICCKKKEIAWLCSTE